MRGCREVVAGRGDELLGELTGFLVTRCASTAACTADRADPNAAHTPSPVCLNNQPPFAAIADRKTSSCSANSTRITSASASHRRVELSMSVNRNVTVPDGLPPAPSEALIGPVSQTRPRTTLRFKARPGSCTGPRRLTHSLCDAQVVGHASETHASSSSRTAATPSTHRRQSSAWAEMLKLEQPAST